MAAQSSAPKAELIPYNTLFPHGEAQKAAQRVLDEIAEHQRQLERLRLFASENADLLNLVRRLPDDLHHDVMVPFGKAAFFPGRLIHTNEFLVLLGEGYYADRTAKQTAGVLKRRGEVLESKMEALGAAIADLRARAEFFDATAGDSAEGIVEIREFEEPQTDGAGLIDSGSVISTKKTVEKVTITSEEYSQILAGLDKLEMAELAAEGTLEDDEDECSETKIYHQIGVHDGTSTLVQNPKALESASIERSEARSVTNKQSSISPHSSRSDQTIPSSDTNYLSKVCGTGIGEPEDGRQDNFLHKSMDSNLSFPMVKDNIRKEQMPRYQKPEDKDSTEAYSHRKAFTGTIIEHSHGLNSSPSNPASSQVTTEKPSKPVSRFKMQRGH